MRIGHYPPLFQLTGPRISGGRLRELAYVNACPLHTLDGRREALDRQRMSIRGPDGVGAERPRHRVNDPLGKPQSKATRFFKSWSIQWFGGSS